MLLDVEVAALACGLQLYTDHRVAAVHEQLDERAIAGVLEPGGWAVIARVRAGPFHQVSAQ